MLASVISLTRQLHCRCPRVRGLVQELSTLHLFSPGRMWPLVQGGCGPECHADGEHGEAQEDKESKQKVETLGC